jgi:hypothetical protein
VHRADRQPYHLHVLIVLKSGNLNLLEPSGPVQAFLGMALPLPLYSQHSFNHFQRSDHTTPDEVPVKIEGE